MPRCALAGPIAALLLALSPLAGCGDEVVSPVCSGEPACSCAPARELASGLCCPSWTTARRDTGECIRRPFTLPSASDAIGDPGARYPSVAIDGLGCGLIGWEIAPAKALSHIEVGEESSPGVFALREPGAALSSDAGRVTAAAGFDGRAVVVWSQGPADLSGVFVSERSPGGVWSDPPSLDARFSWIEETSDRPHATIGPTGEALVVWDQWIGENIGVQVARRPSPDVPWQMPATPTDVLSPKVFYSNEPRVVMNARGDALIAWLQSPGGALMAYESARFGPDGQFERPGADDYISPPGAPIDQHLIANPRPALAPDGRAAVAWTQENGAGAIPVYLAERDAEGRWTLPESLESSFSIPEGTARCPLPLFGPFGDLYIAWYQGTGLRTEVFLAHRAPGGAWIHAGRAPLRLSTPGVEAITPAIAAGGGGSVLVAWSERAGSEFRVAARRGGPGLEPWGPVEPLSSGVPGGAFDPSVSVGGPGERALVAWKQGGYPTERLFVARVE